VLGGDFGSRLNARLRIKEGLTYGSFCFIDANLAQGPFEASAEVNPSNIVPAEKAMDEELAKYFSGEPTQDEFDHAKGFLKGNFSVRLDSNGAIARELTTDVYLGRGVDYLQDYSKLVDAVTMADVKAAIKQNIDPSKMVHVRAGTVPQK